MGKGETQLRYSPVAHGPAHHAWNSERMMATMQPSYIHEGKSSGRSHTLRMTEQKTAGAWVPLGPRQLEATGPASDHLFQSLRSGSYCREPWGTIGAKA